MDLEKKNSRYNELTNLPPEFPNYSNMRRNAEHLLFPKSALAGTTNDGCSEPWYIET